MSKQKLELTWVGKEEQPRLEPRILLEDPEKSYHAKFRVSDNDIFDNRLIFGDNLLALKALEQEFTGRVKCIFIDPPYNTGSAFEHYDDGMEHSLWLSMMRDRIVLLHKLLAEDGSLWIAIDDNEAHYLKVLCDEVFGRVNFMADVIWQKVYSERMDAKAFSSSHDHILVYQKTNRFQLGRVSIEQNQKQFNFFEENTGKRYRRRSLRKEGSNSLRQDRPNLWYSIKAPDGTDILPVKPDGTEGYWRWMPDTLEQNSQLIEFVKVKERWEVYVKQFLDQEATRPPSTIWTTEDAGHNHEAKLEVQSFNKDNVFATPKPERLLTRILRIATNPGDLVLDSFAGSGTTGAVAHKMGRRWIMIELGEHCHTHIIPRLQKVIDGTDQGGISKVVNWQGGGGFRYCKLAPSLLQKDKYGNWIISKEYNAEMLAEAMCKHEGFTYAPNETVFWKQGQSTEHDFIYTTTVPVTAALLETIADQMGGRETLLICCTAFLCREEDYPQITLKRIPSAVLARCEFGRDDYSLQVIKLEYQAETGQTELWGGEDE